ncbi:unnamed protein product [Psylliodes chrysocephalus]|uniref:Uncharacterized protein n=1 Tax=Psylliodes chrysocephalus TaxID=3402493 RepID=A0A9P0CIS9_9CUCU|nr:unnamed protein product [Psylliodes chrysocephala]
MNSSSRASRILRSCLVDENNTDALETPVVSLLDSNEIIDVTRPNYVEAENSESAKSSSLADNSQQYTMETNENTETKFVLRNVKTDAVSEVSANENSESVSDKSDALLNLSYDSIDDPNFSFAKSTSSDGSSSDSEQNRSLITSAESSPPKRGKKRAIRIPERKKETIKRLRNVGKKYQFVFKSLEIFTAWEILAPYRVEKSEFANYFFKNTLEINDKPIRTVLQKKENGFLESEKGGKLTNHFTVEPIIKESVRNHINSIPRMESHYLRVNTSREYIDGDKSLADLHRDYVK